MVEQGPRAMSTVQRAIAVLGVLAESSTDLGTNEIARRVGTNVSTASRLLATLASEELVLRVPESGRYRPGFRLVQWGNAALARVDVRELARPHLEALTAETGETATLSVAGEYAATTVDYVQSPSSVRSVVEMGRPSVPHATAVGKVFLAHGGRLEPGPLTRFTARTITDREQLRREVARAARRGWAEARGEREDDLYTAAVPVLDTRGGLAAVLAIQGPRSRLDAAARRGVVEALLSHARRLEQQLASVSP